MSGRKRNLRPNEKIVISVCAGFLGCQLLFDAGPYSGAIDKTIGFLLIGVSIWAAKAAKQDHPSSIQGKRHPFREVIFLIALVQLANVEFQSFFFSPSIVDSIRLNRKIASLKHECAQPKGLSLQELKDCAEFGLLPDNH
jgi:hypothetical protein